MNTNKRIIAVLQVVLLCPAALFMTALLVRQLQPPNYGPAHAAQQIIAWFAGRGWTLWVLLIGMPSVVLVLGCLTLLRNRNKSPEPRPSTGGLPSGIRWHFATILIAAATLAAAGVLAVVAVHMLAN